MNRFSNGHKLIFLLLTALLFAACSHDHDHESAAPKQPESTLEMVRMLQQAYDSQNPQVNPFANSKRLSMLQQMPEPFSPGERTMRRIYIAMETLFSGDSETAITLIGQLQEEMQSGPMSYPPEFRQTINSLAALAYLRLGEQQNCELNHSAASCLLPIQGDGIHQLTRGSEGAIGAYTAILEQNPDDLQARWLLNVAYMTLGLHPEEVPSQWLISLPDETPNLLAPFTDIAPQLGVDVNALSGGSVTDDFTGNGFIDILTSSWGLRPDDQLRFFVNNGDGTFTDRTTEAGLAGIRGGLNMAQADFTNNGFPDVFIMRGAWLGSEGRHPNSLLRNNGDGTFTDVTREAGLLDFHPTGSIAWADFDGDGHVDLFVGHEQTGMEAAPSKLFRNNGDGTFTDVSRATGLIADGFVKGAVWGDINNNGRPDLFVSRMNEPNLLFLNLGPDATGNWRFEEIGAQAGVQEPLASFTSWFWDFNQNGYEDLFVSGYFMDPGDTARELLGLEPLGEMPRLYRNNGDGTFTDITREAGLWKLMYTMGANFGDFSNNGLPDIYIGTGDPDLQALMPNRAFLNLGNERFAEVTLQSRLGHLQKGHAVSFADFNHNGRLDIHANIGGALEGDNYMNAFFVNGTEEGSWVSLELLGRTSNRSGLGARIRVASESGSGPLRFTTVRSGGSFGASPMRQHVGLDGYTGSLRAEVQWPSGEVTRHEGLHPRTHWLLDEDGTSTRLERAAFDYQTETRPHDAHHGTQAGHRH